MRRILVLTLLFAAVLVTPVMASEVARDSFLSKLESCLDLYQSQQENFQSLSLVQEATYTYGDSEASSTSTNNSEYRINFNEKQAAISTSYSDQFLSALESAVPANSSEYYFDGLHYYSAYGDDGQPLEGQYYYDSLPFDNVLYQDIRSSIPDYDESGSGLAYLAGVLPADCFVQAGDQVICNVDQTDFDKVYGILAERVQAGDTDAQAALDIIYPAFLGYEYNQDDFLRPLDPESCPECQLKGMPESANNTYSNYYKFTVDNTKLYTRTITASHYEYDSTMPGIYDEYRTVVNTRLDSRTGQFEKSMETTNTGVMQAYSDKPALQGDVPEAVGTTTYENVSTNSAVYTYSKSALDLEIPVFDESNSQPAPMMNTGNSYWYLISY